MLKVNYPKTLLLIIFSIVVANFFIFPLPTLAGACRCAVVKDSAVKYSDCFTGANNKADCDNKLSENKTYNFCSFFTDVPDCEKWLGKEGKTMSITTNPTSETPSEFKFQAVAPVLQINIPTLQPFTTSGIKQPDAAGYIYLPFLGQYLIAIFRWVLLVCGTIAAVLIMAGGFVYMTAGGNKQKVDEGKDRIMHALGGLLIILGSYSILYIINPGLVEFRSLKLQVIKPKVLTLEELSPSDYASITGGAPLPPAEIIAKAKEISTQVGLDTPCYMIAIVSTESGGKPGVIGHDENYTGIKSVPSRKNFLLSGKKYSGATFTPPVTNEKDYNPAINNKTDVKNDDGGISSTGRTSPDYGVDWRDGITHGFGLGQITFGGKSQCNGQRGVTLFDKCYSIPDLLKVDSAIEVSAKLFKFNFQKAQKMGWTGQDIVRAAFWGYAAGASKIPLPSSGSAVLYADATPGNTKWKPYNDCKTAPAPAFSEADPEGSTQIIDSLPSPAMGETSIWSLESGCCTFTNLGASVPPQTKTEKDCKTSAETNTWVKEECKL
ncbi:MAG: pilin [Candidatus Magasanikbacteria bacterium]|nr:pilin [Candidatus Magasanikbacteria bacterium]